MRKIAIILSVLALIANSCGNKKIPFDYTTLSTEWTALIRTDIDGGFAVCDEADVLLIEGNELTFIYVAAGGKWELEIVSSYQTNDTIVLNVKPTGLESSFDLKVVWLDKERGIAKWIDEHYVYTFVTNEKLSEFPKAKCAYNEEGTRLINVESKSKNPKDLVRSDETIFEKIAGDLNKDGKEDCVIITKQTYTSAFVADENRGELDRNRRGILIAFKDGKDYKTVLAIPDCFSSENEDGGVYFAPELSVEIKKGNLLIHYGHGRYGGWGYTFRYQNNDFELIGYDAIDMMSGRAKKEVSINFLKKKKQTKTYDEDGEYVIEETWQDIEMINGLVKLTNIKDFGEFSVSSSYTEK